MDNSGQWSSSVIGFSKVRVIHIPTFQQLLLILLDKATMSQPVRGGYFTMAASLFFIATKFLSYRLLVLKSVYISSNSFL
jgi:hypothetical protein